MSPKPQLNIRISEEARKLLKLLAFIWDRSEAQVIEDALLITAIELITYSERGVNHNWEDEDEKLTMLIRAVEKIKGVEVVEEEDGGYGYRKTHSQDEGRPLYALSPLYDKARRPETDDED